MNTPNLTIQELVPLIHQWAKERGIFDKSTPFDQLLKTHEEVGELIKACYDNDKSAIQDAIGDVMVTLINYCYFINEDITKVISEARIQQSQTHLPRTILAIEVHKTVSSLLTDEYFIKDINAIIYASHHLQRIFECVYTITILENTTLEECLNIAYNEIKDREGKIINGKFIKNEKYK